MHSGTHSPGTDQTGSEKNDQITNKGEECLLIGDLNRNVDKPTELAKTRLMQSWFDTGKIQLLNDLKIHTRINPMTGRGSTLDLGVITPGLRDRVEHFKADTYRRWSLHGTVTDKSTGQIQLYFALPWIVLIYME